MQDPGRRSRGAYLNGDGASGRSLAVEKNSRTDAERFAAKPHAHKRSIVYSMCVWCGCAAAAGQRAQRYKRPSRRSEIFHTATKADQSFLFFFLVVNGMDW
jgi:hypothetical protein